MTALTILMPVREFHREYLDRALASVFGQTSPDWRLMVVADPDRAETLSVLLSDALADQRVKLVESEGSRLAGAINTGMRRAESPFAAILLGDDMWAPEAVAVLTEHIARLPEVDFFHSARRIVNEDDRPISSVHPARESFAVADFARASPVKHLLCWRIAKGLAVGGIDESIESVGADDWDFPWAMAEHGARFHAIQDCLYIYRDHRESYRLTTHQPRSTFLRGTRQILRKHGVGPVRAALEARSRKDDFLRQCLYRSRVDRMIKERRGFDAREGWREQYR